MQERGTENYWNQFYSAEGKALNAYPSQFAAFVAGELQESEIIVDLGCGTGKDSFFFSLIGRNVVGIDASLSAIEHCKSVSASGSSNQTIRFHNCQLGSPTLAPLIAENVRDFDARSILLYCRFFLHAIDEAAEREFFALLKELRKQFILNLALEFRTRRDAPLSKITPQHYRRYIEPAEFLGKLRDARFTVDYFVEGFGFAKYAEDDAHVARVMASAE